MKYSYWKSGAFTEHAIYDNSHHAPRLIAVAETLEDAIQIVNALNLLDNKC